MAAVLTTRTLIRPCRPTTMAARSPISTRCSAFLSWREEHEMTSPRFATERGFEFKVIRSGDTHRPIAQFRCVACGDCLDIANGHSGKPIEFFVDRAQKAGWAADLRSRAKCYCPRCQGMEKAKH